MFKDVESVILYMKSITDSFKINKKSKSNDRANEIKTLYLIIIVAVVLDGLSIVIDTGMQPV